MHCVWMRRVAGILIGVICGCAASTESPFFTLGPEARDVTATSALIYFETAEPASCLVRWGETDALGAEATDPAMNPDQLQTEHRVPLVGLSPATTYFVAGVAVDEAGVEQVSPIVSFATADEGDGPINHAAAAQGGVVLGKSSSFGGAADAEPWGAGSAIDGSMNTAWSSDGDGDDAWIEIGLAQPVYVSQVGFASRSMADGTAIIRRVEVLLDGGEPLGPFELPKPDTMVSFDLDVIRAQRVRFQAVETTGGNTGAVEVEVHGVLAK